MATCLGLLKVPPEMVRFVVLLNIYEVVSHHILPNIPGEAVPYFAFKLSTRNLKTLKEKRQNLKVKKYTSGVEIEHTILFVSYNGSVEIKNQLLLLKLNLI